MNAASLRERARSGQLEVEHLLKAARTRSPAVADEIERISRELRWSTRADSVVVVDGASSVPLATWAEVAVAYIRDDHRGLLALCDQERHLVPFVLSLLAELHDSNALASVVRLSRASFEAPEADRALSFELASTFNLLLSFPPNITATDDADTHRIRCFLHELVRIAETDVELATAMTALRGVGDESSLKIIDSARALPDPWDSAAGLTKRAIRRRIGKGTARQ